MPDIVASAIFPAIYLPIDDKARSDSCAGLEAEQYMMVPVRSLYELSQGHGVDFIIYECRAIVFLRKELLQIKKMPAWHERRMICITFLVFHGRRYSHSYASQLFHPDIVLGHER